VTDRIATRSQIEQIAAALAKYGITDNGVTAYIAGATGRPIGTPLTPSEATDILRCLEQQDVT
jgi:hypothetical protein